MEGSYSKNISLDLHVQKRKSVVESVLLILNNQYTCDRYHNGSWFGEGKYGSTVISKVNLKKFEEDLQL